MTDTITLAHGSGGRLSHELVDEVFVPIYGNDFLSPLGDSAVCNGSNKIAFTTDTFVVNPLFFPGGDIGKLCICGTVNDLSVSGAIPKYISVGMVIESGFETEKLKKISKSIRDTAYSAGVKIVTGDTKVVEKGKADGIYINTSGIGVFDSIHRPLNNRISEGDCIICSSNIGSHGTAIMAARNRFDFSPLPESDVRPLNTLTALLSENIPEIHFMRDPTRGGVSSTLCEWVDKTSLDIEIDLNSIPILESTNQICSILGIDPLNIANEGVLMLCIPDRFKDNALNLMRQTDYGKNAAVVGKVINGSGNVYGITEIGTRRKIIMPNGEILPRIC